MSKSTLTAGTELEMKFANLWELLYPQIDLYPQLRVIPKRRFAFDFAHIPSRVAIEIQGGTRQQMPSHASHEGIKRDCTKSNLALMHGWMTFKLTSDMITEEWIHNIASVIVQSKNHQIQHNIQVQLSNYV